jgi:DtxR family Mn-dependent transcriptional regulator
LVALTIVRKHRLWEVFLVEKLNFSWDEVHETAEQLEHIHSAKLIDRLDAFLGYPRYDPHGDPIPDANGEFIARDTISLSALPAGASAIVAGVSIHTADFLQYLTRLNLTIGAEVTVLERLVYDDSCRIHINGHEALLSGKVAHHLLVLRQ